MALGTEDESRPDSLRVTEFERMTRQHVDSLRRTAYRMTGSHEVADDMTQETCLKAFRSLHLFEEGTNYKAWLFRILSNLCTDHFRREARAPFKAWNNEEVENAVARNDNHKAEPEAVLQNDAFCIEAIEAMGRLAPDLRIVVCYSLLDEMSYQEIADILDVPIGTVRSRLSRGRKKLQQALKAYVTRDDVTMRGQPPHTFQRREAGSALTLVHTRHKQNC